MGNIKTLKRYEKLAHSQPWNKTTYEKIRLLNLINDFEQVFPMGTAIKWEKLKMTLS